MAGCCRSAVCEQMFKPRAARKTLRRYHRRGLDPIERGMIASVPPPALEHARVLEIGGGIGTIQAELILAGASQGEIVELVSAYEPYARELAREKGIESRSAFRVADVLSTPEAVSRADIVVLNRVVCCSPDGVRLTGMAAGLASRMLLVSYPRGRFAVRLFMRVMNSGLRIMGRSFRVFLHPRTSLYHVVQDAGLEIAGTGRTFVWEFSAFRRSQ
jgi:magnesium-protoporphyrin O-methyltransferase